MPYGYGEAYDMNLYYVVPYPNKQKTCPPCAREGVAVADGRVAQNNFRKTIIISNRTNYKPPLGKPASCKNPQK